MAMADAADSSAPFIDPLDFPEDFASNLTLPYDFLSDLDFDGDVHFSIEDLLDYPDADPPPDSRSGGSESNEGSGVSSSPAPGNGTSSSVSGNSSASSPDSSNSAAADATVGNTVVKPEEQKEKRGLGLKRKKERADGHGNREVNTNGSEYVRSSKFQRSGFEEASSPCFTNAVNDDDEKRRARLIRNRESAQLSRQRKKHHVEELEEKVRSMHSMISDLNGRISYFMAENASLRQQLGRKGGNSGKCPPPSVYPAVPPMAPMPYPWLPCSGYAVRPPAGTQVPLVPIPRLKPQQSASTPKPKKTDGKKAESKSTKKVASVSLLGLLAFIFFLGIFVPGVDFREAGFGNLILYGYTNTRSGIIDQYRGRILSVTGNFSNHKQSDNAGLCGEIAGCRKNNIDKFRNNIIGSGLSRNEKPKKVLQPSASLDRSSPPVNASQPLLASLYVPRNEKLVKIDGNLIISSVLASERATAQTSSELKSYKTTHSSVRESKETSLAIARSMTSALAVHKSGRNVGSQSHMYRSSNEHQRALPHGFAETHKDNSKSTSGDGPLKEWFREGLEGPVFSSGMCTEVFQFNVAPASGDSGGIISAASMVNVSDTNAHNSSSVKMKNRRILYPQPIPLNGSKLNNTEDGFAKPKEDSGFHHTKSKSMVVSVLVDPREAGDGDGEGMMQQPKSISRIFVVVLLDNVKYITYSCVLPFKSSAPHIQ